MIKIFSVSNYKWLVTWDEYPDIHKEKRFNNLPSRNRFIESLKSRKLVSNIKLVTLRNFSRNLKYESGYQEGYNWVTYNANAIDKTRSGVYKELRNRGVNPRTSWAVGFVDGAKDSIRGLDKKYPKQ